MRVAVTGGAGFLGRYVARALEDQGDDVFVVRSEEYDLRDPVAGVRGLLYEVKPEAIVHLAARVGGIGENVERPGEFLYENALMGLQLLEEARRNDVAKFVVVGTACMYPEDAPIPTRESDLYAGRPARETSAYGFAKRLLLEAGAAYREQYDFDAVFVIPSNLYGPGDRSTHVMPSLIRRFALAIAAEADEVVLWGTGSATRDFLYVEDAAAGIVAALNYYDEPTPVNLGSGVETPIYELALEVAGALGYSGAIRWDPTRPEGTPRRLLDVRKAATLMGWYPETPLADGLKRTIAEMVP